jgi:hypothetical protein
LQLCSCERGAEAMVDARTECHVLGASSLSDVEGIGGVESCRIAVSSSESDE